MRGILEKSRATHHHSKRPSLQTPISAKDSIGVGPNYDRYGRIELRLTRIEEVKIKYNVLRDQNELRLTRFEKVKYNLLRAQNELALTRFGR